MGRTALAAAVAAAVVSSGAMADTTVSPDARKDLGLTVYNGGTALVRDTRTVSVSAGRSVLSFTDVAAQIQPETALLKGAPFEVLQQNFDFDLLSPQKLLEKAVGGTVQLYRINPASGEETHETATVLGANNGVVLEVNGHIEAMDGVTGPNTRLVFDRLPPGLRSRPTLSMTVDSKAARSDDLMLTYLTGGLSWKADYVANLAPDDKSLSLQGWITVTNTSGADYDDASLQVVAGQVNRVSQNYRRDMAASAPAPMAKMASAPSEESFFDYHLYTVPGRITLADNQTKQLALLEAPRIAGKRILESRGNGYWYWSRVGEIQPDHASITLKFENREANGLGMPLPGGVIRVYKEDSRGQAQFVGEDNIDHTPKNEEVTLDLGQAFDVTVLRKQTDFRQTPKQDGQIAETTTSWQVSVKNGKKEAVDVRVVEPMQGDWTVTQESQPHVKESSTEAVWTVKVPAEGESGFTYTVVTRRVP
ncbi:MAG: DUF4139 domain-containing protein [Alphaproteobacteria bacterium]|nr:DUF4139 domain-containing protein [Alphaproteobacteria bacterium]